MLLGCECTSNVIYVIPLFISVLHTANRFGIVSLLLAIGEMSFCLNIQMVNALASLLVAYKFRELCYMLGIRFLNIMWLPTDIVLTKFAWVRF